MIPNKEIQELAQAFKRSAEYNEMMRLRRKVMEHPRFGRHMLMFEREHSRLYSLGLKQADISPKLKKLYSDFHALLSEEDVKKFTESAQVYQKMVNDSLTYLTKLLEAGRTY